MARKYVNLWMIPPLAAAGAIFGAPAAAAVSGTPTVSETRPCTGSSVVSLDARRVGKVINVKVGLATQDAGRLWTVRIWQNGGVISNQVRRTGLDGSFTVRKRTGNTVGPDSFRTIAKTSGAGHESCTATVTVGATAASSLR